VYIIICLLVIFTILCFIISKKNNSNILYGSYQSETTDPTIQIVVDRKFFTEYTNSKKTSEGTIHEEEKNVYILNGNNKKAFLYKDGKSIVYFNPNSKNEITILKKILDTPTYITGE